MPTIFEELDPSTNPTDIASAAAALRAGTTTSAGLVERAIARADLFDPQFGVYLRRFDDHARAAALRADEALAHGYDLGPLQGVPLAVKDMLTSSEGPTTVQSMVPDAQALEIDAAAVSGLRRAGAIIMGKTTLMEYSKGAPDLDSPLPFPRNPWSIDHWTGGSSSGTAGGIAAGFFFAGLGTDSGGSIRIPASYTGTSGHKPTYDLVPRGGLIRLSESLDHIGPMGHSAHDCALLLDAIVPGGTFSVSTVPVPSLRGFTVRVDTTLGSDETHADVTAAFTAACEVFSYLGATIVDAPLPRYAELNSASSVIAAAEAYRTHSARLAGGAPYRPNTVTTLTAGANIADTTYRSALQVVEDIRPELTEAIGSGVLLTPTAPTAALSLDAIGSGTRALSPTFTRPWNAVGFPATAIPMGFDFTGLPVGLQVIAPLGNDERTLRIARTYQAHTTWHRQRPSLR